MGQGILRIESNSPKEKLSSIVGRTNSSDTDKQWKIERKRKEEEKLFSGVASKRKRGSIFQAQREILGRVYSLRDNARKYHKDKQQSELWRKKKEE